MSKKDMITWFINEIGFSNEEIAEMLTFDSDEFEPFSTRDIKQMKLNRRKWPEGTWDTLRCVTTQKLAQTQELIKLLHETGAKEYVANVQALSSPLGRLGVLFACILLDDNTPVVLE